jgi:cytochrome P450
MLRRRSFAKLASGWDFDASAVRFMQYLRRKYGEGPVLVSAPGRQFALLLDASDVKSVLDRTPDPFSPASREKRAALRHFEPHASLVTAGDKRPPRRAFNDTVLESASRYHSFAGKFASTVRNEAGALISSRDPKDELKWPAFAEAWFRSVRCIVLGEQARDDRELTEDLARLRARANWVYLRAVDRRRLDRHRQRLAGYLRSAQEGTLVELARRCSGNEGVEQICDQISHWLFAFDAGGITTFRALALFASHPAELEHAGAELAAWRDGQIDLPYLSAGFLEAVRLWPTTPVILRETTRSVTCGSAALAAGSGVIVYAPFFDRDDERLPCANEFTPDLWLGRDPGEVSPFVPFSAGPAVCPGRYLVTLVGTAWLAALLDAGRVQLASPPSFQQKKPLPGWLDQFALCFRLLSADGPSQSS